MPRAVSPRRTGAPRRRHAVEGHGLSFAFYGRTSTVKFQDRATSIGWQREVAEETIRGHGTIVAEYFDEGCSRRLPWRERPAAAQLIAAAENPNRSFDAVVIGYYERAFYGDQFNAVLTTLREQGIQVWLPEVDGPVNLKDPVHQALMLLLGSQSHREGAVRRPAGSQQREPISPNSPVRLVILSLRTLPSMRKL